MEAIRRSPSLAAALLNRLHLESISGSSGLIGDNGIYVNSGLSA
jgi:hypothetical protein